MPKKTLRKGLGKRAALAVTRAATKTATEVAVGMPPHEAVGSALSDLVSEFLQIGGEWVEKIRFRRALTLWESIASAEGVSAETLRQRIRAGKSESFYNVIKEAYRELDSVIDEAVIPSIGTLISEYNRTGRDVDGFFRGAARLLADVDRDEFASLHTLLQGLKGLSVPREKFLVVADGQGRLTVRYFEKDADEMRTATDVNTAISHARRIFYLLNAHGLALGPEDGGIALEQEVVRHLAQVISLA